MKHDDIRHRLSEYIDGSVTPEERAAIEAHLKTCPQCSSALEELRKTIEHVKTIEEIEPPSWMTQKIMATVRAEAEEKKGFFQRFFLPLRIKLPIQAVAVLFLAITAYYINQTRQPTSERSEAPLREFAARNEAPPVSNAQDKLAKANGSEVRSKKVGQAPEYKALDMKLEYEKPAAPIPRAGAAAPAPVPAKDAEQSALPHEEASIDNRADVPPSGAPAMLQEQIEPSSGKENQDEINNKSSAVKQRKSFAAVGESTSKSGAAIVENQFQLGINQTISFDTDNVRLTFVQVTEDSRCPVRVRCTWEGQVTVVVQVMTEDRKRENISLTHRAGTHEDLATKTIGNYILKLLQVDPYPKQGDKIKNSDYRITLFISKI